MNGGPIPRRTKTNPTRWPWSAATITSEATGPAGEVNRLGANGAQLIAPQTAADVDQTMQLDPRRVPGAASIPFSARPLPLGTFAAIQASPSRPWSPSPTSTALLRIRSRRNATLRS